ncbi:sigma-70 family RNA polymerase sigma factor [Thermoleophilia bacterium SCSIO 60948]|nr:sigma-70 family RNA polymerase sigma factor [Thermoleophilia bacterium SCSIO 60948]
MSSRPSSRSARTRCASRSRAATPESDRSRPGRVRAGEARTRVAAVWRVESRRIVASLTRVLGGDLGLTEDAAQDALVAALETWPRDGVPANPGAWLQATARNRALDRIRHGQMATRRHADLARELERGPAPEQDEMAAAIDERAARDIDDEVLRLIFMSCHPALGREVRVALCLRSVAGLTTPEIARAFLVSEPTVAQRIVRAKRTLREREVEFEVPGPAERPARVGAVLEVIYLIFNEGYAATSGDRLLRRDLCREAQRLGRTVAALMPDEPEALGLLALIELQASRLGAREDEMGDPVPLDRQDRARWDRTLIAHAIGVLERAEALPGSLGPYGLQARIAAVHARAAGFEQTDWRRIADTYLALAGISPSPVIELNRAVAVGRADGPGPALEIVAGLEAGGELAGYHLLPAVRGDLLERDGRSEEAAEAFEAAAELCKNERERDFLRARARSA